MNLKTFEMDGLRGAENPAINMQLGMDPLITELVLGTPQARVFPGQLILKPIRVPNLTFMYQTWGTEHLRHYNTERAMRAPINHADFAPSTATGSLKRFSFGHLRDQDEFNNAQSVLGLREKSAGIARRWVDMDIEQRCATILTTAGNYSGNVNAKAGGTEWNASGGTDMKTDIDAALTILSAATGLAPEDFTIFMPMLTLNAAKADPVFLAARTYTSGASAPGIDAIRDYLGVKRVWTANPVQVSDAGVVSQLYGDICLIYFEGDFNAYDTEYGDQVFGASFKWNKGVASEPFYIPERTSWFFPWTDYWNGQILNASYGYLITNCAA
jgi:hypothetical protein